MTPELQVMVTTAAVLGVTHTAVGVDHTLPFVMLGRARAWGLSKTLGVTALCSAGHVLSSVVIGFVGYFALDVALSQLEGIEEARGQWAAWGLMGFGAVYALVALWRLRRGNGHQHVHVHADGTMHTHAHDHGPSDGRMVHHHQHGQRISLGSPGIVPVLFVLFVLGPCEALIPLMVAPALGGAVSAAVLIALVFGVATLVTMLGIVALGYLGLSVKWVNRLEPHLDWLAGVAIFSSGLGVELLGI